MLTTPRLIILFWAKVSRINLWQDITIIDYKHFLLVRVVPIRPQNLKLASTLHTRLPLASVPKHIPMRNRGHYSPLEDLIAPFFCFLLFNFGTLIVSLYSDTGQYFYKKFFLKRSEVCFECRYWELGIFLCETQLGLKLVLTLWCESWLSYNVYEEIHTW